MDLFCGAGGLTHGLIEAGVRVVAGVDSDEACEHPYTANHEGIAFHKHDIAKLKASEVEKWFGDASIRVLAGCAPCQPFSSYSQRYETVGTEHWGLLNHFARLVEEIVPDIVTMENVPTVTKHKVFDDFVATLRRLGYEVWYYVLFGIFIFARRRWMMIPTVLVFVGPKIAAMFPLWLIGVFCYHRCRQRRRIGLGLGLLLWASSLAAWAAYEVLARYYGRLPGLASSRWLLPELTEDYLVGSLFAANLLGFDAASRIFGPVLRLVAQPIRWAAGGTFTLYLVHLPIAQFLAALAPWAPDTWRTRVWILGGTLAAVFLAAEGTERRKRIWRRVFVAVLRAPLRTAAR